MLVALAASNQALPAPAGATTTVIGDWAAASRSSRRRAGDVHGALVWWRLELPCG